MKEFRDEVIVKWMSLKANTLRRVWAISESKREPQYIVCLVFMDWVIS